MAAGLVAPLAMAGLILFYPFPNTIFAKNYFSGNWNFNFPIGPSVGLLALSSSVVGFLTAESILKGTFLRGAFLLSLLAVPLAIAFEDNWKDKTFTALICIQAVHGLSLLLICVPAILLRHHRHGTRIRLSIQQMMMWTFVTAVAIWVCRTTQPHINQTLMLKHVVQPTFNYWILIVGVVLALNTIAWRFSLKPTLSRKWTLPFAVMGAVLLGYGSGVLYLSINSRWDTSMHAAKFAVHSGYVCCFLLQGAMIYLLDLGAAFLPLAAIQARERRTIACTGERESSVLAVRNFSARSR
ncbi:hypothetical protein Poly51_59390 [Rubripirellula tenax]|uniref:Uncharacterized protein n=2 Tax=Rubripirellula tenax TaxID=2528015 RepID=A0A5C6E776_9BACT|nr:hypothetical protein Poly51_59390 [Rubripirellula tenax]